MHHPKTSPTRRRRPLAVALGLAGVALLASSCISAAGVQNDVLTIVGSSIADTIVIQLKSGDPSIVEVDDAGDGTIEHSFDRSTFSEIVVDGAEGDDVLSINQANGLFTDTELTTLLGGEGNDTLVGASGGERLEGGPGTDDLNGRAGTDVLLGGDDADEFAWVPGDGSDLVDGGPATDRLVFTASNASEVIELSNLAGQVRLTRNVASIVMDMDGVETVDLNTLGGADVVTVNDLTGTDLTTLNTDLAGFGGTDDAQLDEVRLPVPSVVGRQGATAVVDGLGAQVRVANGSPTDRILVTGTAGIDQLDLQGTATADTAAVVASGGQLVVQGITPGVDVTLAGVEQLDVDLGGGDDQFSSTGDVASLATMDLFGGDGRDTISGGNGADVIDGGSDADNLDGNQGADSVTGGDGSDVVTWDPGDGSDSVDGGADADRLVFNGSSASEIFDMSDLGGQVRLTRNVGSIVMDMDGVETVDLNMLGGTDVLTVNDLTGTDLSVLETDLTATGGVTADGAADQVVVNGTTGDDVIDVYRIGAVVETSGLATVIRTTGADPALDRLTVNGLAGDDTLTAAPAATALILIDLFP